MPRERFLRALGFLNLSRAESEVYIYVCSNPNTTAGEISKGVRVARSKTYDALEKLGSMGLVSKIHVGEIGRYCSSGPDMLAGKYAQRARETEQMLEYLRNVEEVAPAKTRVKTIEGAEGYKGIRENSLLQMGDGDEMLIVASPAGMPRRMVEYFARFQERRIRLGLKLRIIFDDDVELERLRAAKKWKPAQVRVLPKSSTPSWIEIYGKRVLIPLIADKLTTIAINDEAIAKSFKNYFEAVWTSSRRV
jgi:sugar-specific transcriptional regulator TrmB